MYLYMYLRASARNVTNLQHNSNAALENTISKPSSIDQLLHLVKSAVAKSLAAANYRCSREL